MSQWLWVVLAVAALPALLLLMRLKLRLCYDGDGGRIEAAFGLITVPLVPAGKAAPKRKKPKQKRKKTEEPEDSEQSEASGGSEAGFRELAAIILRLLGKLKRRLCIDELTLWYQSAAADPAAAALAYGGANAAACLLLAPLEEGFRVKKRDVRIAVSFTETKPTVVARLRLSMPLWALLYLGAIALRERNRTRKRAEDREE